MDVVYSPILEGSAMKANSSMESLMVMACIILVMGARTRAIGQMANLMAKGCFDIQMGVSLEEAL